MNEKLEGIKETVLSSSTESLTRIIYFWDNIVGAILVLLLGFLLASFVGRLIYKIAKKVKLINFIEKIGFNKLIKKANIKSSPSEIITKFLQAWIVTVFLLSATTILHLHAISQFLETIINFLPNMVVALFIVLFAVRFGDFIGNFVSGALSLANSHAAKIVAITAKNILIAFGIMAAIFQLKIPGASDLIEVLFIGFVAMLSLAGGLAFGLGSKDFIAELLQDLKKKHSRKK